MSKTKTVKRTDNIEKMDFDQLRKAVQLLRDDVDLWKRKYEDAIQNLDESNFSKSFTVTQNRMKAQFKIAADAIKSAVTEEDLTTSLLNYSTITQTAQQIELAVSGVNTATDEKLKDYTTITQTAQQIELSAQAINAATDEKLKDYATLTVTRDGISSFVQGQANTKNAVTITDISQAVDITKTYKIQSFNSNGKVIGETYYYYNKLSNSWEKLSGDTIYTMFTQTDEGFILNGNTIIDGSATITRNLVLSGNVTWDMSNSPVKTQYSVDGVSSWHTDQTSADMYMRMSFDGGTTWSTPTKVVGTDGKDGQDGEDGQDGWDGSDAYVTAQNVFDALTSGGTAQGLFPAFYDGGDKLFINATYIKTGQLSADRIDTESLSCTRLYAKGYTSGYYAKMSSNVGDFGVYNSSASSSAYPNSEDCIWGIYHSDPTTGVVNFYSYGNNYMGYNDYQGKLYPKGIWDFSACDDVLGLDAFVSGGSGGTTVAVFG